MPSSQAITKTADPALLTSAKVNETLFRPWALWEREICGEG
ncbi:MAG: hypothetical protein WD489_01035 [Rhodovibrionaceae bacterium]